MNVDNSPPQVVVAYDFSRSGDVALERAVELACRAPHHVLHFLAAIDPHTGLAIPPDGKVDYRYAERIAVRLGHSAMNVMVRLSAFIVLSIGVEIAWNGIKALLEHAKLIPP